MANKNKIRWALYRLLRKEDWSHVRPRRGGYSLDYLLDAIDQAYGVDLTVIQEHQLVLAFKDLCLGVV